VRQLIGCEKVASVADNFAGKLPRPPLGTLNLGHGRLTLLVSASKLPDPRVQNDPLSKSNGVTTRHLPASPFYERYLQFITNLKVAITLRIAGCQSQQHTRDGQTVGE
jgi:hypothetical protein